MLGNEIPGVTRSTPMEPLPVPSRGGTGSRGTSVCSCVRQERMLPVRLVGLAWPEPLAIAERAGIRAAPPAGPDPHQQHHPREER